jgi:glycerophosphoryl diester phosphodiesterase
MTRKSPFLRGQELPEDFLVIGHRGARALAPENTLASIRKAAEEGASMVEVDLQLSRDGVPVVFHDYQLDKRSDACQRFPGRDPWELVDFDLVELQSLDASAWFQEHPPYWSQATAEEQQRFLDLQAARERNPRELGIPTLEEVLLVLEELGILANLELKAIPYSHPDLVPATLALLDRLGKVPQVLLSSFDHALIRQLKSARPEVAVGVLTSERMACAPDYLVNVVGADSFHPGAHRGCDSLGLETFRRFGGEGLEVRVKKFQNVGLRVFPWTVNAVEDQRALREAGVDGIITDFPRRLRDFTS